MGLEEKFLECETDSRVKGMCILNLTAFVKLPSMDVYQLLLAQAKYESACFLLSASTVYFQPSFIFAKPYVKNRISKFNWHFSSYE